MFSIARLNGIPVRRSPYWAMVDDFFRPFSEMVNSPFRTQVKETEDAYLFEAELPGFETGEIDLTIQDGMMTVAAEHKEGEEGGESYAARSVRRSFTVEGIDEENVTAEYRNGILRVRLPKEKAPVAEPAKKIEIVAG